MGESANSTVTLEMSSAENIELDALRPEKSVEWTHFLTGRSTTDLKPRPSVDQRTSEPTSSDDSNKPPERRLSMRRRRNTRLSFDGHARVPDDDESGASLADDPCSRPSKRLETMLCTIPEHRARLVSVRLAASRSNTTTKPAKNLHQSITMPAVRSTVCEDSTATRRASYQMAPTPMTTTIRWSK